MNDVEFHYYKGLSHQFPTIATAATEIINLQAILNLPKATEHFITDVHGEHLQFQHIIRNGSGSIRRKIDDEFGGSIISKEKRELAALIYYPEEKIRQVEAVEADMNDWYQVAIYRLIMICKHSASKYTRSKVRKAISPDFAYVIEELLTGRPDEKDQEEYYQQIISSIISTGRARELVIACSNLIRRLVVDHLHVVGDIFDRGPYPHRIMDDLMEHHSVDIQWGNHDLLWMGAAAGNAACICNVTRIAARYGNLPALEEGYGINMLPLAKLAMEYYNDDPCECFTCKIPDNVPFAMAELGLSLDAKMHKAITVLQFKLEGQLIKEYPEFHMEDRLLLSAMDLEKGIVRAYGKDYELLDRNFPTIDPEDPYKLTSLEEAVMHQLSLSFKNCEKLQKHIDFLFRKGSLYKVYNGNLLFHGCVPMTAEGDFQEIEVFGEKYKGKALYDALDKYARAGFYSKDPEKKKRGVDMLWYLWESPTSPVFGKDKMTTFERYFIADKESHKEPKNSYYSFLNNEAVVDKILNEFGLSGKECHIINGHIPVEAKAGESPVKCNGKLLVIDGGLSRAYQPKTGIAGYTLIYNSYGLVLAAHEPFTSIEEAVTKGSDIHSDCILVQKVLQRKRVADTDIGRELQESIDDLQVLLKAYRNGELRERF